MKNKALEVCSYYMGTNLYKNLFNDFSENGIDHDILYFCAKPTVIRRELPDNFIVSQPYDPIDRVFYKRKHRKVYNDTLTKINTDDYYMTHAHSLMSNGYISYRLKKEYNIPYIVAVRNTDLFVFFKYTPWVIPMGKKILEEAEKIIFISPKYRDITIDKYISKDKKEFIYNKSVVIPNGIDDYYLNDRRTRVKNDKSNVKIIFISRYIDDRNKNVRTIVKSCEKLIEQGIETKLTLIGKFKRESNRGKFQKDFIKLVDFTDEIGVKKELEENDIFVMPSKRETFGLVYVEAMSQGLPVIYTKNQGFDGHFEEGEVGYHVHYNNVDEIVSKIKEILDNYNEMSKNASSSSTKFNWHEISKKYIDIYNDIREK